MDKALPSDSLSATASTAVLNIVELLALEQERRWPPMLIYTNRTDNVENLYVAQ